MSPSTANYPPMNLLPLRKLLADSSDRDNPPPERIREVFAHLERIAVVGISRDPEKAARRVPSYLAAKGFEIIPVNPHADRILGRAAVASLEDVSDPLDMVLIFRPSDEAGEVLAAAARRPERPVVWLQEGIRADGPAAEARARGVVVVQDLCAFKAHRALSEG